MTADPEVCVLDASAGVKWFRDEPGSSEARRLLRRHIDGEAIIAVDTLFMYEVMAVCARDRAPEDVMRVWTDLEHFSLAVVPLGERLVGAAAQQRYRLECSLYDAFSAGLASLLNATLYSADAKAHGRFERVRILDA
ncbi:MAG: type II toxin-antitoxin system VapC family toxin [Coriobacteriia bacterium]